MPEENSQETPDTTDVEMTKVVITSGEPQGDESDGSPVSAEDPQAGANDVEPSVGAKRPRRELDKRTLSVIAGLLVGVLAFAITVQVSQDDSSQDFDTLRGAELAEMLKSIDASNQRLAEQIEELSATRDELKADTSNTAKAEKAARQRADALAILAGSAGAVGPGVQITITAPAQAITASVLLDAVQEMRDAGAEAIVINGVARVVAHTWFADDDEGVRVAGRILQPPYVIEVIGDPHTLQKAVTFRGGLADRVSARGGTVEVNKRESISITALADELEGQYARPAK
ncbi:MAG: DUF881 domain-containing protein [Aeromicrobium sp.]|nr:MAG: DUF881 domain-containing protein [Aeromicrobium sp.]